VVFGFAEGRGGQHVRGFLGLDANAGDPATGSGWHGQLVYDFSGYNACFELRVTGVGCLTRARSHFQALWASHGSQVGERTLNFFGEICDIEREVQELQPDERRRIRQKRSAKAAESLHQWLEQQRKLVPEGSATAKTIDYSLKRWKAVTRFTDDGELPTDKSWVENHIRGLPSAGRTGSSPARCAPASGQRR
jgi:transposase